MLPKLSYLRWSVIVVVFVPELYWATSRIVPRLSGSSQETAPVEAFSSASVGLLPTAPPCPAGRVRSRSLMPPAVLKTRTRLLPIEAYHWALVYVPAESLIFHDRAQRCVWSAQSSFGRGKPDTRTGSESRHLWSSLYTIIFARPTRFDKLFPPPKKRARKLVANLLRTGHFRRPARANLENPRQKYPQPPSPDARAEDKLGPLGLEPRSEEHTSEL